MLESLIYETIDGKPFYRKGYRDVVAEKKTLEEIKGTSTLQSVISYYLIKMISMFTSEDRYFVLVNKPGVHIDHRSNLVNDVAIYDQAVLPPSSISKKYADVPPRIAIEVDINIDAADTSETSYIYRKTRKLLDFGVEKVIWVLTDARVVIVATNDLIETIDWSRNIELMDGQQFNVGAYLQKRGITVE
ncbi:Uma2 family endonuclease [Spirosoma rhododendri]|uniref:Uma2 family endonuclease n=1 Tax=Spirosoma rhododendri TaxID=2728024 RepID=A0A7L5DH92_9BACT|nr:Uma2 family endonuclease [Spirosoma rhododendri]QJD77385.1 Uma2 family endonuclease [Spirosoma rhododendri]